MRRCWPLLMLLCGCDIVLGLDRNAESPGGDANDNACDGRTVLKSNAFNDDVELFNMFDRYELDGKTMTQGGNVVFTPRTPKGYVSVATNGQPIDFTGLSAHVRIVKRTEPPNSEIFFGLHLDDDRYYFFSIDDGLAMGRKENGIDTLDQPMPGVGFDPLLHVWIRFRHDRSADDIVFETRVTDGDWVERHRIDVKFDLRTVRLRLGAGLYDLGSPIATSGVFDDFALCN